MTRRYGLGFWAVACAFLIVMAFATLPSPLYGLYRVRDHLSASMITVTYSIYAVGTIAAVVSVRFVAARIGRRGVMLAAGAGQGASAPDAVLGFAIVVGSGAAAAGALLGRGLKGAEQPASQPDPPPVSRAARSIEAR
jgi:hypothetical protein